MPKTFSDVSFADILPASIRDDETVAAAAAALDDQLAAVAALLDVPAVLYRVDELTGTVLDLLAWQLHVDGWDPDMPDANKRAVIKSSIATHKQYGTPGAVQAALDAAIADATLSEWFDYGGDPYYFKVLISVESGGLTAEQYVMVTAAIAAAKNVRSHLELLTVDAELVSTIPKLAVSGPLTGSTITVYPEAP